MKNWKTTAAGVLSALIATVGPLTAYLATQNSPKATTAAGIVTLVGAIARIWIGLIQNDAPDPTLAVARSLPPSPTNFNVPKLLVLILCIFMLTAPGMTGCASAVAPTPPLAPGYTNQADQVMGQTLAAAHAFYQSVAAQSAAGTLVLSAQEKAAFNDLGTAINAAQTLYIAFHNGQTNQATAQAAIDQVTTKQSAVQALMPGVQ